MKKYLKYLLSDIETAQKNRPPALPKKEGVDEMFRGPEEYFNSPLQKMSEWFGLDAQVFPPAERWSLDEMEAIVSAMTELWEVYNYDSAFPEGVDTKLKYELFVRVLTDEVPYVSSGLITIDFCDEDVEICGLGEFCSCREMLELMDEIPHKDEIIIAEPNREVDVSPSMQRYYEQLLQDLNTALQELPDHDEEDFEDDFYDDSDSEYESIEELFSESEQKMKPLSEWLNIPQTIFPEIEQLSVEMVIELVRSIEKIWWYAGFVPYFPEGLHIEMKYSLFRENWNREVPWPTDESVYIGFCDDDEDNCIYGKEMCTCALYKLPFGDDFEDEKSTFIQKAIGAEGKNVEEMSVEEFLRHLGFDAGEFDDEEENNNDLPF